MRRLMRNAGAACPAACCPPLPTTPAAAATLSQGWVEEGDDGYLEGLEGGGLGEETEAGVADAEDDEYLEQAGWCAVEGREQTAAG